VAISPKTLQNDTYYTIEIGKAILQNGIDMQDSFSWHENLPYTYPHWAYDVFIYLIYSTFNLTGIYISTCILSAILGLVIYGVNGAISKNKLTSFIITLGAMYMLKDYITARAQLVTFTLFMLTIYFIEKFLETKKKRYALALIVIPIIIANVHVAVWPFYFILYLPYIAEYLIAIIVETVIKPRATERKISCKINNNTIWLVLIMIICFFTGLATPLGSTPYTYLEKTMMGNTMQNISEHLPMTLINHHDALCLLVIYLAILIFTKAKIKLSDLFMLSGLALLMLYSRRQEAMLIIICSVILNKLLVQVIEIYTKGLFEKIPKGIATKAVVAITVAVTLGASYYFTEEKKDDQYIDESAYPVKACDYILENIDIENMRIFNEYNYGSYMIYRGIPVFIDSRADLYTPEFNSPTGNKEDGQDIFTDFINVSNISVYYEEVFEKYGITHVITMQSSKLRMLIDERTDTKYRKIYNDDNFVIYEIVEEEW
jgi:hypothetical protein